MAHGLQLAARGCRNCEEQIEMGAEVTAAMITPLINQFVYRPDATFAPTGFTPADLGLAYEEVSAETTDGVRLSGWYLPASQARHALLYCHGNAGDIRDWVHAAPPFLAAGCSLLIFDYRGYGASQGKPSEQGLYLDGEAVWQWLHSRAEHDKLPASILGKSLGSAVAIHVAAQESPASLILDSALTSMREVVATNAPWLPRAMIPSLFESLPRVPHIRCPTLVIHGRQDSLVPLTHGQRIFEALTAPKRLHIIEQAGHNDISGFPEYQQQIDQFLADLPQQS
jgi:fermentation-respiration switch protein FrsA (DUF1100 family)